MDISDWKIYDLHRRGAKADIWYFKIQKPDGKRLYIEKTGYHGEVWSSKVPGSGVWSRTQMGATELYVKAGSEAGAVRKIMRYVEFLAKDWNLREKIKAEAPKQVTFDGKRPRIMDAGHQLESAEPKPEPVKEKSAAQRLYDEYFGSKDASDGGVRY